LLSLLSYIVVVVVINQTDIDQTDIDGHRVIIEQGYMDGWTVDNHHHHHHQSIG